VKVAILGFAPSYVDAPFGDPSVHIWTMNYHHQDVTRTDRIFELHDWDTIVKEGHVQSLQASKAPVYLQDVRPEIPSSVRYPIEAMTERYKLPNTDTPYFTNTASYMIALAIEEGVTELQLFGLDMTHDTEYGSQRPSCEFFLGVAMGRGIRVVIHRLSDLCKTAFLYGYEDTKRNWFRDKLLQRRTFLVEFHDKHKAEMERHARALSEFSGALQNHDHILKVWG